MKTSVFISALSMLALAACASAPAGKEGPTLEQKLAERGYKSGDKIERIADYRVDGWQYVDPTHVVFTAGPGRDYLVTVRLPCSGLNAADAIGFTSTVSYVTTLDKLVVKDAGFDNSCLIDELREVQRIPPKQS